MANERDSNQVDNESHPLNSGERRLTDVTAAILRMTASLEIETVLQEAIDSARALTGAESGSITTVDPTGQAHEFVTSGITEEQRSVLTAWPHGTRFLEHLREITEPFNHESLTGFVQSLGLEVPGVDFGAFLLVPLRHRGASVGGFFMVTKNGSFSDADSEVLVLLASQAAAAIENARAHREQRSAREDLETLVETSPVGVVVVDVESKMPTNINAAARRILSDFDVSTIDVDYFKTIVCRRADGREVTMNELPHGELLRAEEVEIFQQNGPSVRTLLNATPICSADGAPHTFVVTMQDLAPLEALVRARTDFLTMVSHELRAPLAAVKGSAATVLEGSRVLEPIEVRQFFRIVEEHADRMDTLISDLLDAGRISMGTLSIKPTPTTVLDMVEQARRTFTNGTASRGVHIDLQPDLPQVLADAIRIEQVLGNLLSNAARYAPLSTPIHVEARTKDNFVHISVTDEGESLDSDGLSRLFDTYTEKIRAPDGAGLGLAICKGLVEAHGGRIQAKNADEGRGTQITFTLPIVEAELNSRRKEYAPVESEQRKTILVIDDDPETLRHVRESLDAAGYYPVTTVEPRDITEMIREHRPQLVLLDLVLPRTDGIQLMRDVAELAAVPVIFISQYGQGSTMAQAFEAGAVDYIVKPFSAVELTARVNLALRKRLGLEPFVLGDLVIDYERRHVRIAGSDVSLTVTEFEVLRVLSLNVGRAMSFEALTHEVWHERNKNSASNVRGLIKRLRRKLHDPANNPKYILSERGVGYRMPSPLDR